MKMKDKNKEMLTLVDKFPTKIARFQHQNMLLFLWLDKVITSNKKS